MSTLIFDIETVGEDWSDLDQVTKESLLRYANRVAKSEGERLLLEKDIKEGLGFSPLTGRVVALGLYDLERSKGVVYYTSANKSQGDIIDGEYTYKVRSEKELLEEFWQGAEHYNTFITFNGRAFDAPFLFHRSAVYGIRPTKNLLEGRYPSQQKTVRHVDLQDELTFFGAMSRRPSLHLFCRAYGIDSPKGEVSGDAVAKLYKDGEYLTIARYNAKDVTATTELYKKWLKVSPSGENKGEIIDF
jgi:DNA polymerase elongation subunit (family B)